MYSVEWANIVITHVKKQILEINMPAAPRLGASIKQTFKSSLADPAAREQWVDRYSYRFAQPFWKV